MSQLQASVGIGQASAATHAAGARWRSAGAVLLAVTTLVAIAALADGHPDRVSQGAGEDYGNLPLAFVPNAGQTDESVRYTAQGGGFSFYFTDDKAVLSLQKGERGHALQLRFLGASASAKLVATDRGEGRVNYLMGSEHHTDLPTYNQLVYRDLWPGIDMAFRGAGGQLKYEFRLQPGANPADIRLAYAGDKGLSLASGGALLIETPLGALRDSKPKTYQRVDGKRTAIDSRYALAGSSYGFALGGYDRDRPLVIDPGLAYSTLLGGSGFDEGYDIAVDSLGAAYITGSTLSTDFPTTPGAFDLSANDVFITKLNAGASSLAYSTYLGGSSSDGDFGHGGGIAVDSSGAAYVIDNTASADFPTTAGAFDTTLGGGNDAFVVKLNPAGSGLTYSTYLGGASAELGRGIAVDSLGDAYVTGRTDSADFPTTIGAFDTSANGAADAFVTKLNTAGSGLAYSTYLGGSFPAGGHDDGGFGIAVDSAGAAYVAGDTASADFPTTVGAFDTSSPCACNTAFVTKMNPAGSSLDYSTYLGGNATGFDHPEGIAVDVSGSAYVTGQTSSPDFPTTGGALDTALGGGLDAFVTKLNAPGSGLTYSTYLGGSSSEQGFGIAIDSPGAAYVTGRTDSVDFPTTAGAFDTSANGSADAFVTKLDAAGSSLTNSTYLGGSSFDRGGGIAVDSSGAAYVTGGTNSSDFPTTAGAFDTSANGDRDAFVTKLSFGVGYPRPKGATPARFSLVPAYTQCTSPNRVHGPPDFPGNASDPDPACNPPAQSSGNLTVGTPDANIAGAKLIGSLRLDVLMGVAGGIDDSDIAISVSITDVRCQAGVSTCGTPNVFGGDDYTGEVEARVELRITDKYNGVAPGGGTDRATGDTTFEVTVPCGGSATPDTIGSTCELATTADAVYGDSSTAKEGARAIWELGQVDVHDGGTDGDVETPTGNTLFMRQGVFVP